MCRDRNPICKLYLISSFKPNLKRKNVKKLVSVTEDVKLHFLKYSTKIHRKIFIEETVEKQDNIQTKQINERASNFPSLNFNLHYICQ